MFFVVSDPVDFVYLTTILLVSFHWNNFLKPILHDSRPYYDDITLTEPESGNCAGEFGNPSAHALMAAAFIPSFILLMRDKKLGLFERNQWLFKLMVSVLIGMMLGICFCRFYLARHSVDQIIFGLALGLLQAHFSYNVMRPRMFDPYFRKDNSRYHTIKPARRWRAFKLASFVFALLVLQCVIAFFYVEHFVEIPSGLIHLVRSTCPKMRKVDFLHYAGAAYSGYCFVLPCAYFFNALEHSSFG
jgi:membrane-associated phospholipid phosphatase